MDDDLSAHLYLLTRDSAQKKRVPFRLTFKDWKAIWGEKIDQRGSRPGDYYLERIVKEDGYTIANVRISVRPQR